MPSNRLDIVISQKLPDFSRAVAQKLIKAGKIAVNGKIIRKVSTKISETDILKIPKIKSGPTSANIHLRVIYEDKDTVAIDKPAGMLTHSKGTLNEEHTVATWLAHKLGSKSKTNRDGIVHRLDRGTSGVIICAKNDGALKYLQKQFSTRKVSKTYIAIVAGTPTQKEAMIDMPIQRNPKKPQTFRVNANGKSAKTQYKVLKKLALDKKTYSLVELKPETGRTHQLRVHMSHLGHPILGDAMYKGREADRMYLHASELELKLPDGKTKHFSSKLPVEFDKPGTV